MATTVASLQATLSADTSRFDRSMRGADARFRSTSREASRFGRGVLAGSGTMSHFGRSIAFASGAFLGAAGFTAAIRGAFDEMNQSMKVAAQVQAVLESTGGVANVTAKHVDDLANALLKKSGVDDEAIKSGEALLLTFTNVRNELGQGNDIFDQSTKAILDMSVAMNTDMRTATLQVGKALQDPIRGITALRRVGVAFTDAQQEQIKALVEGGHAMEAQKMILAELNKEFGGSAEAVGKTLPGQWAIFREGLKNTSAEILTDLMPTLLFLTRHMNIILPVLAALTAGFVAYKVAVIAASLVTAILEGELAVILSPIGLVAAALAVLAVGLVLLWKKSETFRNVLTAVWKAVKEASRAAITFILGLFANYLTAIATILHVMGKLPGPMGAPFRAGAAAADHQIARIHALQDAINHVHGKTATVGVNIHIAGVGTVVPPAHGIGGDGIAGALGDGITSAVQGYASSHQSQFMSSIGALHGGTGPASISPSLYDDLALGHADGLTLTSGYRPGAITSTGNVSLHSVFPSKAIDMAGSEAAMQRFFLQEVGRGAASGLREIIHSPYWWHPGSGITGITAPSVMSAHWTHVHVGSYAAGGPIPGPVGRPYLATVHGGEYVLPANRVIGSVYNFNGPILDGDKLLRFIREAEGQRARRGGA